MAELIAIAAPADQAEGTEMVVATWFKQVGDSVTQNEPLLEISTDKVTVEVAAPATGILREIVKSVEQSVAPGEVLGRIEAGAAAEAAELTPAVRRALVEHGLSASQIAGTGRGGRITVQDVEAHVASRAGAPAKVEPAAVPSRRVPHTAMRRSIAQHMTQSVAVAPHVTAVFEADLSAIVGHREAHRAAFEAQGGRRTAGGTRTRWSSSMIATSGSPPRSPRAASSCRSSIAPRHSTSGARPSGCRT